VKLFDFVKDEHKNVLGKTLSKYKTKISTFTKRPARDLMAWNYKTRIYRHTIWEKDDNGNYIIVHDKPEPFRTKK